MNLLRRYGMHMLSVLLSASCIQARIWTELDQVSYRENDANDGDSFHAKRNSSTYIFRLYYVDAPESDLRFPDRVQKQADYFGVTPEQAVEGAKKAAAFIEKLLSPKPFTVFTRYDTARGASSKKRYYAMVQVGERWLSELLVENGYARVFGVGSDVPDGTEEKKYWSKLQKLEAEAKAAHRGLWGKASGKIDVEAIVPGQKIKLPKQTIIFHKNPPHHAVGMLPAQWSVVLGESLRPGFRKVTFTSPGGAEYTGEIQEASLK